MNERIPNQNDIHRMVTDRIIKQLEDHEQTWDKPWVTVGMDGQPAQNAETGNRYKGINQLLLGNEVGVKGYPLNKWLTFKQIKRLGGSVEKGEKASHVVAYGKDYRYEHGTRVSEEDIKGLDKADLKDLGITEHSHKVMHSVFNVFQTKGLPEKYYEISATKLPGMFEKDEMAEKLITNTGAKINYALSNAARYSPDTDIIHLPIREQFKGKEAYYDTALHEVGHWTGHESRLNRLNVSATPANYAKEELVAELCAAFLCAELGFSKPITNNAAYVKCFLKELNDDKRFIFKAAAEAEKATNFVWELHRQKHREERNTQQEKDFVVSKLPIAERSAVNAPECRADGWTMSGHYSKYLQQKALARNPGRASGREER